MASKRKATLFVHPTFGARDDRLKAYGLVSAIGRLTDTSIAIARLLYSGHLTKYPDVNVILSHGGAALPMALGRLRRSFETTPADNVDPMLGFRKLYFDSIVYDATTLKFVCDIAGADRVLMGTDLPFAIGDHDPVNFIDSVPLSEKERQDIKGLTAKKLFHI
jgi:aminocarboxymuconate-semialdehyde decarboxylase